MQSSENDFKQEATSRLPGTILSLIVAFLGIIFISFFTHWYEVVIMEMLPQPEVLVNAVPPLVLFMMVVVTLALNPLLKLISPSLVMGSREMFMALTLWLITGVLSFTNLTTSVMMTVGNVNAPATDRPVVQRVGLRDHLNQSLFLSSYAADEYHAGISPDGSTRIPPFAGSVLIRPREMRDVGGFAARVLESKDALSIYMRDHFSAESLQKLREMFDISEKLSESLLAELNEIVHEDNLYDEHAFANIALPSRIINLIELEPEGAQLALLNRQLLQMAYSGEIDSMEEGAKAEITEDDIRDFSGLARKISEGRDGVSRRVRGLLSQEGMRILNEYFSTFEAARPLQVRELNRMIEGALLFDEAGLEGITLSSPAMAMTNRILLERSYPDYIVQPAAPVSWPFIEADILNPEGLAVVIERGDSPVDRLLRGRMSERTLQLVGADDVDPEVAEEENEAKDRENNEFLELLLSDLNSVVRGGLIYDSEIFEAVGLEDSDRMLLNRLLIENAYSREVTQYAAAIPWRLWIRPMTFWTPFMLLIILFSASLVRMMHRQWSQHELLTYPLAEVMDTFLSRDKGGVFPDVCRTKTFWVGFTGIFLVFLINGLHVHFPLMINIPMAFRHTDLLGEFDFLARYCGREAYALLRGFIYPFIIAIAVLLPTDLSLTSWLGFVAMVFGTGFYFILTGDSMTQTDYGAIRVGMYFALGAVILFIGRREYFNILKHAVMFKKSDEDVLNRAAWACRMFILAFIGLVVMFMIAGLEWFMAVALVLSFGLMVLLMARLTAETGIPWLVNFRGFATSMPLRLLGAAAVGPQALAVIATVGMPLDSDPSNSVQAQETIYNKNREKYEGSWLTGARFNLILCGGVIVALSATIFFQMWNNYTYGSRREPVGSLTSAMTGAARDIDRLRVEGLYEDAVAATTLSSSLGNFEFDGRFWNFFIAGVAVIAACALMRLRFTWWPFHPLPLLFIDTWTMSRLYTSIFFGWVIKSAILRIWGGKTFGNMKPFFLGVIVGQAAMLGVWLMVGAIGFVLFDITPSRMGMWL